MRRALLVLSLLAAASGCRKQPHMVGEVVAAKSAKLPDSPADAAWDAAPEHLARMIPQDVVEPRQLNPTTPEVRVRALADGSAIAFRLEWAAGERSDTPGPARFADACAVQLPEKLAPEAPSPQMGEEGRLVQVAYWRADWQASVDGRGDTLKDLYPNSAVDHYPFQAQSLETGSAAQKEMAQRYAPARRLGNIRSGPRAVPVESLVAAGPGTLSPGPDVGLRGKGVHANGVWRVVIARRLPEGLAPKVRTQVAFAVWQGAQNEAGGRKMRTGWIGLLLRGE